MLPNLKCGRLVLSVIVLAMTSACNQTVPDPRTVSDFCLQAKRISVAVAPGVAADDPGNQWDTEETVQEVFQHNSRFDRVCTDVNPVR